MSGSHEKSVVDFVKLFLVLFTHLFALFLLSLLKSIPPVLDYPRDDLVFHLQDEQRESVRPEGKHEQHRVQPASRNEVLFLIVGFSFAASGCSSRAYRR